MRSLIALMLIVWSLFSRLAWCVATIPALWVVCVALGLVIASHAQEPAPVPVVAYDIVYVRAPRYGDTISTQWQEVRNPIQGEPGTDLMLRHPDGTEEVLVLGGTGAAVDPCRSFDGEWVYYAYYADLRQESLTTDTRRAPKQGSDLFKIHVATRQIVQLTHGQWTPNSGVAPWSSDPVTPTPRGTKTVGHKPFNLGGCPVPGGKVIYSTSQYGFDAVKSATYPNMRLALLDEHCQHPDGTYCTEQVGYLNLGSALHPTIMTNGKVMFSSGEAQGLRDNRNWGLWAIDPYGTRWEPLMSAFPHATALHFQTQLTDKRAVVAAYYNKNNNGFGPLWVLATVFEGPMARPDLPRFGSPTAKDPSNPVIQIGYVGDGKPDYAQFPFSPLGFETLTPFAHHHDHASSQDASGEWLGKATHPSGAPNNDLLLVWSSGPANSQNRPTSEPAYDGGIYLLKGGKPALSPADLVRIVDKPAYNEQQPIALVPYQAIYGIAQPPVIPRPPNDGTAHPTLKAGEPFGLVGTSSFYKRDTTPGDGVERFNPNQAFGNWRTQGADAGWYTNADIYAVRILTMTARSTGVGVREWFNHVEEKLSILGEIPLRKYKDGQAILDVDGNPDTSFLAKIPADTAFTFQTLDKWGAVLNNSQTWHGVRPGEMRNDCGGCHGHNHIGTDFSTTVAAKPDYVVPDLTQGTPRVVEYFRDIKPVLQQHCVTCHSAAQPNGQLVLDDTTLVDGMENTYNRLANDPKAQYGYKPLLYNPAKPQLDSWKAHNASRYIRKLQSRRSLLWWVVSGARRDGKTNDDFPTERVTGDKTTLPVGAKVDDADVDYTDAIHTVHQDVVATLTDEQKRTIAAWIDTGCSISTHTPGIFRDEQPPIVTIATMQQPVICPAGCASIATTNEIVIGAYDVTQIQAWLNGQEITTQFQHQSLSTWRGTPDVGVLTVRGCDTTGNCTAKSVRLP